MRPDFPPLALWALGITQIVGYGTLYYGFAILAPGMATHLGWPLAWVFAAFSAALIVGGLFAPFAGRLADRHGAARVMVGGSVAAALALLICAFSSGPVGFMIGLVGMELAGGFALYNAAFVAIVQYGGQGAERRITHLTLIAGFASTLFWPLTTALAARMDWHQVYLIFALLNLGLCLPLHLWLARIGAGRGGLSEPAPRAQAMGTPVLTDAGQIYRVGLWLLAGFAAVGAVLGAILVHMVPLLQGLGLGAAAAIVAGLFGPAQVASRLINMLFGGRLSQMRLALVAVSLPLLALAVLLLVPGVVGAAGFALLFGMGSGLISIISGTLPLELFGREGYGARLGRLSAARQLAGAIAPFLLALGLGAIGAPLSLSVAWAIAALALGCFAAVAWAARPAPMLAVKTP